MLFLVVDAIMSDNIRCVSIKDNANTMAEYIFDITCTNCRETNDSPVSINRYEKHEMPGSRGEASFVAKCKFCGKDISINIAQFELALLNSANADDELLGKIKDKRRKRSLKTVDLKSAVLLEIDSRGSDITHFYPGNISFIVELMSGKKMEFQFEDDENEWYDYDDKAEEEVSITEFKAQIIKGK
ncbi:hypothetical protein HG535_0F00290 [Zygotorulaspora mrakii]|uniref:DUF866-domain-containing protein n=1 Tax=Zygotorulaspora mrakii TaxID=42260 RepID=A0A7H9B6C2_ZYGMR|nr:uncharacterized protein HG535_0F00290 [Zygotorulaspora mrakii]QLG73519.1 hypothetical protein HG535_0F00290 [Zygotorulaspora mrakii]